MINAGRLLRASDNPVLGQTLRPSEPVNIDSDLEYTVSKVLSSRIHRTKLQYQVDWEGYDPDLQWYPARNLKNAPIKLLEYHQENPTTLGPPRRLQQWIEAAAADKFDEDHEEDDYPIRQE